MIVSLLGLTINAYENYLQALEIANMNSDEYFSVLTISSIPINNNQSFWFKNSSLNKNFVKLYRRSIIVIKFF